MTYPEQTEPLDLVLVTGQSLAAGRARALTRSPVAPDRAFSFSGGPVGRNAQQLGPDLVPLAEDGAETIASGFAAQLLQGRDRRLLVAGQAWLGQPYEVLREGGASGVFEKIIAQAQQARRAGLALRPGAILLIHGESDGAIGNGAYDQNLLQWRQDFAQDLSHALGFAWDPVMLFCQTSSISGYAPMAERLRFQTPIQQIRAAEIEPRLALVGPKYQYDYFDHAHIDGPSTRLHGEQFAKVYRRRIIEDRAWRPLGPKHWSWQNDKTLTLDFDVPQGPLVFDTVAISDPGDFGFSLTGSDAKISSVSLSGAAQVTVTFTAPVGAQACLSYAMYNGHDGVSGRVAGARGCLRDSDPTRSVFTGGALYNWCLSFAYRIA